MTDAVSQPLARAITDLDRRLHQVLAVAAGEAARHERVDAAIRQLEDGSFLVRFTSTLPAVEVRLGITRPEDDGPTDVAVEEFGTHVRFPLALVGVDGGGLDRAMARLSGSEHWLALHLRHRIAESVDARTLATPGLDRLAAAGGMRTSTALRVAAGLAAVAGAFLLGGMAAD